MTPLFETIPCPLCGHARFDVIKKAKYSGNVTAEELRKAFSASSSHKLLDQVVRCQSCDLHYLNPRPSPELIIESYAEAEDATFVAQNDERIRTFTKILRKVLAAEGQSAGAGKRFLDVGCAGAASLVAARSVGFEPIGVEPSRWMAEFGRRTYGVDVRDGVLREGLFADESFDVITLWDVLEHVPNPRLLLDLIVRLLRPNGTFILSYPDFRSIMGRLLGDRWPFWLSVHLLYYDRATILKQLALSDLCAQRLMPYWMTLPLGYVVERAMPYVAPLRILSGFVKGTSIGRIPVTYNIGQTIVVAKRC